MAIFGKKESALDKIKSLLAELSDEELDEFKKMLLGETEEAPAEDEEPTEEESKEEVIEEKSDEEGGDEVEDKTEVEEAEEVSEETPTEEPTEEPEAPVEEEVQEEVVEEPAKEPEPIEDTDKVTKLEAKIAELSEAYNNLLAKVQPIIAKFEEVDNDTSTAGMGKPNSVTPNEDEGLSADEWARKHAIY